MRVEASLGEEAAMQAALSNAERQKAWRDRRNQLADWAETYEQPLTIAVRSLGELARAMGCEGGHTHGSLLEDLVERIEEQADWRGRLVERFPDDDRNPRAAENCRRLAKEVGEVGEAGADNPALSAASAIMALTDALGERDGKLESFYEHFVPEEGEYFRQLGFHDAPSAEEFLAGYCALVADAALDWLSYRAADEDTIDG